MRTPKNGRAWTGLALAALGVAMLAWSASATLAYAGDERIEPAAAPAPPRADGAPDARAVLRVETPLLDREQALDLPDLGAAPGVDLDRNVDTGRLPLGARVSLALTDDAAPATATTAGEATRVSSTQVLVLPARTLAAGAVLLTVAGLATYFWGALKTWSARLLVLPLLPLYARITRAEVFDNDVRERIFAAIKARPGLSASDLAKHAGVSWGTTIYHLDVLEQNRMVTSLRNGRHRRYFENGAPLVATKEAVAVLQNPVTATVASRVQGAPGATQKELATLVGLTPQALHWHVQRLVAAGLVRKEREGRVVRHFAQA